MRAAVIEVEDRLKTSTSSVHFFLIYKMFCFKSRHQQLSLRNGSYSTYLLFILLWLFFYNQIFYGNICPLKFEFFTHRYQGRSYVARGGANEPMAKKIANHPTFTTWTPPQRRTVHPGGMCPNVVTWKHNQTSIKYHSNILSILYLRTIKPALHIIASTCPSANLLSIFFLDEGYLTF